MNHDTKIGILGYGIEGQSTLRFLLSRGYNNCVVLDENPNLSMSAPHISTNIWDHLQDKEVIIRTPGISPLHPSLASYAHRCITHMDLFYRHCPCPVIAVTGTKGKGTTSSLIYHILKTSNKDAYLGGNIGLPPLDFIDQLQSQSVVVLETSSFQAMTLKHSPHIGVILMVVPEHLDYHTDFQEYIEAKGQMVSHQTSSDICLFHADYPGSIQASALSQGTRIPFSPKLHKKHDMITLRQGSFPRSLSPLLGAHNDNNIIAACLACESFGVSIEDIQKGVSSFTGLPFRLETIAIDEGIRYVNDSFSTTPETSIAAIQAFDTPIALLLGGSDKGIPFTDLVSTIRNTQNAQAFCYGHTGKTLQSSIGSPQAEYFFDLKTAFFAAEQWAKQQTSPSTVLLSPACASFDQFSSYKERGETFNALVCEKRKEKQQN